MISKDGIHPMPSSRRMGAWLQIDGSLSARIASVSGKLDGARAAPGAGAAAAGRGRSGCGCPAGAAAHGREVILLADGVPVVYARSVLQAVHARGTWKAIRGLGNRALADLLFGLPAAQRSGFEFARFAPGSGIAATVHRRWRDATGADGAGARSGRAARCSRAAARRCWSPSASRRPSPRSTRRSGRARCPGGRRRAANLRVSPEGGARPPYFEAASLQFVAKRRAARALQGNHWHGGDTHVAELIRCVRAASAALTHATFRAGRAVAPAPHEGVPRAGRTPPTHPRTRLEPLPPRHARGRPVAGVRRASLLRRRCRRLRRRAVAARLPRHRPGLDKAGMDPAVRPQDDLFLAMNGGWIEKTEIPADKTPGARSTSCANCPTSASRTSSRAWPPSRSPPARINAKIGDFYTSYMDTAAIDAAGTRAARALPGAAGRGARTRRTSSC